MSKLFAPQQPLKEAHDWLASYQLTLFALKKTTEFPYVMAKRSKSASTAQSPILTMIALSLLFIMAVVFAWALLKWKKSFAESGLVLEALRSMLSIAWPLRWNFQYLSMMLLMLSSGYVLLCLQS